MERVSPLLIPVIILLVVGASIAIAADSIKIEPLGNRTIIVTGPANTSCSVKYRVVEDIEWVDAGSFVNSTKLELPWGKYVFYVNCSSGDTFQTVVDNRPRWMWEDSLFFLVVVILLTGIHIWRKAVVSAVLSNIFFFYYVMQYLKVFTVEAQGLMLFGYAAFTILLVLYGRR